MGNNLKQQIQHDTKQHKANHWSNFFPKGGHSATFTKTSELYNLQTRKIDNAETDIKTSNRTNDIRPHYEKTPMQYTAIFHGCKNDYFQMRNS